MTYWTYITPVEEWVIARLKEKSSWLGIITVIATLLGTQVDPAKAEAIALIGMTFASMVTVATKEQPKDTSQESSQDTSGSQGK